MQPEATQTPARHEPGGFRTITYWAWRLDRWLNRRLGSPYRIVLAIGLAASISASWKVLADSFKSTTNILLVALVVVFQTALLINQLAQVHQRRKARVRRQVLKRTTT
jgi:hypothetical protein